MKFLMLITYGFVSITSIAQSFSENWKLDSLGADGYRKKAVSWDSVRKVYLINGMDLTGYEKQELLELLGVPNSESTFQYEHGVGLFRQHTHEERQTLVYYLAGPNSLFMKEGEAYLTFVVRKQKVYYLNRHYIDKHEKHKLFGFLLSN